MSIYLWVIFLHVAAAGDKGGGFGRADRAMYNIDNDNCEGEDESENYRNRQLSAGDCRDKR